MAIGKNLENKIIFRLQVYYKQVKWKTALCILIHQIVISTPWATFSIDFCRNLYYPVLEGRHIFFCYNKVKSFIIPPKDIN